MVAAVLGASGCKTQEENIAELTAKANKGDVKAMVTLGEIYYGAQNTSWNDPEGAKWMKMAADKGHPKAQWIMGVAHAKGYGVHIDLVESHVLSYQAVCGGYAPAKDTIKEIEPLMSKKELRQATEAEQRMECKKK